MSEPYGDKWKRYTVYPKLTSQSGSIVDKIKLNIGDPSTLVGPTGATGAIGAIGATGEIGATGFTGSTGPSGNPNMQLTAPNGNVYEIIVSNAGLLSANLISTPPPEEDGGGVELF